jgi:hypothetical protein
MARYLIAKVHGTKELKKHFQFGKVLENKSVWRLISKDGLWNKILVQQSIAPNSIEDWIRSPSKSTSIDPS